MKSKQRKPSKSQWITGRDKRSTWAEGQVQILQKASDVLEGEILEKQNSWNFTPPGMYTYNIVRLYGTVRYIRVRYVSGAELIFNPG